MNSIMWAKLKEYILTKNSHGKNELLAKMADLEIIDANNDLSLYMHAKEELNKNLKQNRN